MGTTSGNVPMAWRLLVDDSYSTDLSLAGYDSQIRSDVRPYEPVWAAVCDGLSSRSLAIR